MKRSALVLLLATACAAVSPRPTTTAYAPRPIRLLEPELHAMRPPAGRLLDVTLGLTTDAILRSSAPGGVGYVPCSTSTTVATWQTPASCGLTTTNIWSLSGTTVSSSAGWNLSLNAGSNAVGEIGWSAYPATTTLALRYTFGDDLTGMQAFSGGALSIYSYHGLAIDLGEAGTIPARSTTEDFVLTLHNTTSSVTMNAGTSSGSFTLTAGTSGSVTLAPGSSGQANINGKVKLGTSGTAFTNLQFTASGTWTSTVAANTCNNLTYTQSGLATGDICWSAQSDITTGTFPSPNTLVFTCAVSGTTVTDHICNVGTAGVTITTFHFRDTFIHI